MKIVTTLLILTLTSCLASNISPLEQGISASPAELSGQVTSTEGLVIDLGQERNHPFLLVFAQETCEVCREETIEFKADYQRMLDKNVEIVTVLVGSLEEDALAWKSADNWDDQNEVPWSVGFELRPTLFSALCPNSGTPCSLLQLPGKGVVLKRSGLLHPEEVLQIIDNEGNL